MRNPLLILLPSCGSITAFAQSEYSIHSDKPHRLRINAEYRLGKEKFYEVDYLDAAGRVVKSMSKTPTDDHHGNKGSSIARTITYHYFTDTLETATITIDPVHRSISRTDNYFYNGRDAGWESGPVILNVSNDSFRKILSRDMLLGNAGLLDGHSRPVAARMVKKFEKGRLVYKCYYERFGGLDTAGPARERFFNYNEKGLPVEHISNPKSDAGGTSFMRSTFVYNDQRQAIRREGYSDGRHQTTTDFSYQDGIIVSHTRFYDAEDPSKSTVMDTVYRPGGDGNFYSDDVFRMKFAVCRDLD